MTDTKFQRKHLHGPNGTSVIVESQEQEDKLRAAGWGNTPTMAPPVKPVGPVVESFSSETQVAVERALEKQQAMFDKSWGELTAQHGLLTTQYQTLRAEHTKLLDAYDNLVKQSAELANAKSVKVELVEDQPAKPELVGAAVGSGKQKGK